MSKPYEWYAIDTFLEKQTALIGAGGAMVLTDESGAAIPGSDVASLTLTLYNQATKNIINARNGGSILNVNGGTITELGVFTLHLFPADMALESQHKKQETHEALIRFTYNGGLDAGALRVIFTVVADDKIS